MHAFYFSSSLSFEVRRGKDGPKCAEVGCDRPGAESPQAPSGPAGLFALLGNSRQVFILPLALQRILIYLLFDT